MTMNKLSPVGRGSSRWLHSLHGLRNLELAISGSLSETNSTCFAVRATGKLSSATALTKSNSSPLVFLGLHRLSLESESAIFALPGR